LERKEVHIYYYEWQHAPPALLEQLCIPLLVALQPSGGCNEQMHGTDYRGLAEENGGKAMDGETMFSRVGELAIIREQLSSLSTLSAVLAPSRVQSFLICGATKNGQMDRHDSHKPV
jgi:hypothetical protein